MIDIKTLQSRNKLLTNAGSFFLIVAICLGIYACFNTETVLGINSMIKPIKFALSTWIYSWTLAYLLYYVNNQNKVKWFSYLSVFVMLYENGVITIQAFRGKISHFNQSELVGGILYAFMGIFIVWLTTATLVLTLRFIFQKTYSISAPFALSIKIGLLLFVVFSFFGGYMSMLNTHNVGGKIGGPGLPLVNWSTLYGDLRVAHFFGIHSLQIIPFVGFYISDKIKDERKAINMVWILAILYFIFITALAIQSLMGLPFMQVG
ncbi:MAG: hypothetical protein WCP74_04490 [Sphingobacteriia bacterium]|jgi:hypothetical protein